MVPMVPMVRIPPYATYQVDTVMLERRTLGLGKNTA